MRRALRSFLVARDGSLEMLNVSSTSKSGIRASEGSGEREREEEGGAHLACTHCKAPERVRLLLTSPATHSAACQVPAFSHVLSPFLESSSSVRGVLSLYRKRRTCSVVVRQSRLLCSLPALILALPQQHSPFSPRPSPPQHPSLTPVPPLSTCPPLLPVSVWSAESQLLSAARPAPITDSTCSFAVGSIRSWCASSLSFSLNDSTDFQTSCSSGSRIRKSAESIPSRFVSRL